MKGSFCLATAVAAGLAGMLMTTQPSRVSAQDPAVPLPGQTELPGFSDIFQGPEGAGEAATEAAPPIEPRNQLERDYLPALQNNSEAIPLYKEAIALLDQQRYEEAIGKLGQVAAQVPYFVPALYEQARAYRQLGEIERAKDLLLQASATDRNQSSTLMAELGSIALEQQSFGEARSYLQEAERLDPSNPDVLQMLGRSLYLQALDSRGRSNQQLNQQAKQLLDRALRIEPRFVDALYDRGRVLTQLGTQDSEKLDAAIADLEEAVELQPDHAQAWVNLGLAYNMRGLREARMHGGQTSKLLDDLKKAVAAYDRFVAIERPKEDAVEAEGEPPSTDEPPPDEFRLTGALVSRVDAQLTLGRELSDTDAQAAQQHYAAAIQDAQEVIRRDRFSNEAMQAYFHMGTAYRMMGDHQQAIQYFSDALALSDYSNPEAFLRRGISYFHTGQLGMAAVDFERAQQVSYQPDARPDFWLGLVAYQRGDLAEASRLLTSALQTTRNNYPLAALNRGLCFLRLGNYRRAIKDFDTVLTQDADNQRARQLRQRAERLLARQP